MTTSIRSGPTTGITAGPEFRGDPLRVRVAFLATLMVLTGAAAGRIFDRFEWELPAAVAMAAIVAGFTHTLRPAWRILILGATSALVALAAAAATATNGATNGSGSGVSAVFDGPRRLLTTEWPSPQDAAVIGAVALGLAVLTALACDMGYRVRWHLAPLIPAAAAIVGVLALSAPSPPSSTTLAVLGLCGFGYAASSMPAMEASRSIRQRGGSSRKAPPPHHGPRRTLRTRLMRLGPSNGGKPIVAAAVGLVAIAVIVSSSLAYTDRADPRQVTPSNATASLLQSLESVVALRQADPPFVLFGVSDQSTSMAEPLPANWRLGAFDTFDGQRWVPTVAVRPIGGRLGQIDDATAKRPPLQYTITVNPDVEASGSRNSPAANSDGVIPFPGQPVAIDTDVLTDLSRVVVRLASPPQSQASFQAVSERAPTVGEARDASVATRPVDNIAAAFTETATEIAGTGTPLERLQRLAAAMSNEWLLDPSTAAGGQPAALLQRFTDETRRGTAEQFVGGFVLLAHALGYDARVAIGFDVPENEIGSQLRLRSEHAAVWPEVQFLDLGWLKFDPVPAAVTAETSEPQAPPQAQAPAAAQPPIAPPTDRSEVADDVEETDDAVAGGWADWQVWVTRVAIGGAVALLPLALGAGLILAAKARRRRRRRRGSTGAAWVRGVWANTTDSLVDAGLTISRHWTDDHIALSGADLAPAAQHELRRLAALATSATFGPPVAHALAADAALTEYAVNAAITARLTRWQRWRWYLSLRSLRPSTRSPVVV